MKHTPDFSPFAGRYAASRPRYPEKLFSFLASLSPAHQCAWDSATGSGQAALDLTTYFHQVIATDISPEQIRHAVTHPRIQYHVAQSERPAIADRSVDLITVASALHWFRLKEFYDTAAQVLKSQGILAAWTYHVGYVEEPFTQLFNRFYTEILFSYFAPGARMVDRRYEDIILPGEAISVPDFYMEANWNLQQMLEFIQSWSGTQLYIKNRGQNPTDLILDGLKAIWGDNQKVHSLRWPLYLKISRL
ncbi:MAG: class I SAM-dependent methyltransferase [Calditrichaeota bacterium]|nr:class I SAM-dependent methyltransferase [Calditrichota bacterium]